MFDPGELPLPPLGRKVSRRLPAEGGTRQTRSTGRAHCGCGVPSWACRPANRPQRPGNALDSRPGSVNRLRAGNAGWGQWRHSRIQLVGDGGGTGAAWSRGGEEGEVEAGAGAVCLCLSVCVKAKCCGVADARDSLARYHRLADRTFLCLGPGGRHREQRVFP